MDLHKLIEAEKLKKNNTPVSDFDNLSPNDFHFILYDTYNENSPVHFQKKIDNETLDKIGLFRMAEDFIRIIEREKFIKLTPLGALPRKVLVELYDKKHLIDDLIEKGIMKLMREIDSLTITSIKIVAKLAGITKKVNGKLTLTKKGENLLKPENRQLFFELFIKTFADKFNWGYHDGFINKPIGQKAWTFTIYLLNKYSNDYQNENFYAEKYLKAIPDYFSDFEYEIYKSQIDQYSSCFGLRSFERFLKWFGLVEIEIEEKSDLNRERKVKAAELLTQVFNINN